jgi:hypothetical protein
MQYYSALTSSFSFERKHMDTLCEVEKVFTWASWDADFIFLRFVQIMPPTVTTHLSSNFNVYDLKYKSLVPAGTFSEIPPVTGTDAETNSERS